MKLALLALPSDNARAVALATALQGAGHDVRIVSWPEPPDVSSRQDEIEDATLPLHIVCWTQASAGPGGAALQARAAELKLRNAYLGAILDDVAPPEAVRAAQDVRLTNWVKAEHTAALEPLLVAVNSVAGGRWHAASEIVLKPIAAFMQILAQVERRLAAVQGIALLSLLLGAFGLFSNVWGTQDAICSASLLRGTCRAAGLGNLPTDAQERELKIARNGNSCLAFEAFLRRHGPTAPFADEARQRLALAKDAQRLIAREVALPSSVTWTSSKPNAAAAIAQVAIDGAAQARQLCSTSSQVLSGETTPGRFEPTGTVECEQVGAAFSCRQSGRALCSYRLAETFKVCPR